MFDGIGGDGRGAAVTHSGDGTRQYPLRLCGSLDAGGARELRTCFAQLAGSARQDVVLDLSEVGFMDGTGVGALAFLYRRLAARRLRLVVAGAGGQPLAMLFELGLAKVLGIIERRSASRGEISIGGPQRASATY